jgi:death-on-curing protein
MAWVWLERSVILAAHGQQLAEHGGAAGIRDQGLLDSALARSRNLAAHNTPDIADLAAAYAFGLCRHHPFVDGNKRAALIAAELFLGLNGSELAATDAECVLTMMSLAAGKLAETELAAWIRDRLVAC